MAKKIRNNGHNTIAVVLIFFGAIMLLDRTGILQGIEGFSFKNLWPLIFVIIGTNILLKVKQGAIHYLIGAGFVLGGGAVVLRNLGIIPYFNFNWKIIWPIILILIGIKMFLNNRDETGINDKDKDSDEEDYIDQAVFLGGHESHYSSNNLQGGNLTAVLGGCKIILTDADFKTDSLTINVFAFWGGIELYIPKNWKLNIKCTPIMGGVEHKIISEENGVIKNKTLIIKGTVIMAGVEIKS